MLLLLLPPRMRKLLCKYPLLVCAPFTLRVRTATIHSDTISFPHSGVAVFCWRQSSIEWSNDLMLSCEEPVTAHCWEMGSCSIGRMCALCSEISHKQQCAMMQVSGAPLSFLKSANWKLINSYNIQAVENILIFHMQFILGFKQLPVLWSCKSPSYMCRIFPIVMSLRGQIPAAPSWFSFPCKCVEGTTKWQLWQQTEIFSFDFVEGSLSLLISSSTDSTQFPFPALNNVTY